MNNIDIDKAKRESYRLAMVCLSSVKYLHSLNSYDKLKEDEWVVKFAKPFLLYLVKDDNFSLEDKLNALNIECEKLKEQTNKVQQIAFNIQRKELSDMLNIIKYKFDTLDKSYGGRMNIYIHYHKGWHNNYRTYEGLDKITDSFDDEYIKNNNLNTNEGFFNYKKDILASFSASKILKRVENRLLSMQKDLNIMDQWLDNSINFNNTNSINPDIFLNRQSSQTMENNDIDIDNTDKFIKDLGKINKNNIKSIIDESECVEIVKFSPQEIEDIKKLQSNYQDEISNEEKKYLPENENKKITTKKIEDFKKEYLEYIKSIEYKKAIQDKRTVVSDSKFKYKILKNKK